MMCGLLTPDAGEGHGARLRHPARESRAIKREVGYMTQRFSFYEDLTHRGEPRLRRAALPAAPARRHVDRNAGRARPDQPAQASWPARFRAAGSSAWRWPPASCTSRSCCCSTSRPPASIPRRGANSGTRSTACAADGLTVLVSTHYMDEAERCHRINYIAYGKLMASGTVGEVVARCRPDDLRARGPRTGRGCAASSRRLPGVEQVAPFGSTLHVVGHRRRSCCEQSVTPIAAHDRAVTVERARPASRTCSSS